MLRVSRPVAGRDFCTLQTVRLLPDGSGGVLVGTSVEDGRCPEKPPYVRGKCILAGYVVRKADGGASCIVDMLSHADLNAAVPKFILAKVAEKQPMNVFRLRKLAEGLSASQSAAYQASIKALFVPTPAPAPAPAPAAGSPSAAGSPPSPELDTDPKASVTADRESVRGDSDAACVAKRAVWGRVLCGVQRAPLAYLGGTGKLVVRLAPPDQGDPPVPPAVPDGATTFYNDGSVSK